jgi:SHS2 domain-containing protein
MKKMTEQIKQIEEIEHTADVAIRVHGRDLRALFSNAALGMSMLMGDVENIDPSITRQVALEEFDTETLLVSWLSELLWFNEQDDALFVQYDFEILTSTQLRAKVRGGVLSQQWKNIKAVTYHDLEIRKTDEGLEVTLVFDV